MRKKLYAGLLVSVMVLSLCACGGGNKADSADEDSSVAKTEKADTEEAKEEKHQAGDIVGQWKCVSFTMDEIGTVTSEDSVELFGVDMTEMFSFSAWESGHCMLSVEEETEEETDEEEAGPGGLAMLWTKEGDKYQVSPEDPQLWEAEGRTGASVAFDGEILNVTLESVEGTEEGTQKTAKEVYSFEYAGEPEISIYSFDPEFDEEDTMKMSSFMRGGFAIVVDGKAYGYEAHGKLVCADISADGSDVKLENITPLLDGENCKPACFQYGDGYVYVGVNGEKNQGLLKIDVKNNKTEFLYDKSVEYVQFYDGKIYFTDENAHYFSIDPDGKNLTTIIDDRKVYYPYQTGDGWFVFQDDADGETLHIYHTEKKLEKKVTQIRSYSPIICGDYLYFTTTDDSQLFHVCRLDLNTWKTEISEYYNNGYFFVEGDTIFMENWMYPLDQWNQDLDPNLEEWEYSYSYSDGEFRFYNTSFECWYERDENFGGYAEQLWLDE